MSDPTAPPCKNADREVAPMRVVYQLASGDTVTIENCTFESIRVAEERAARWAADQGYTW
jgi:hypothetical protein